MRIKKSGLTFLTVAVVFTMAASLISAAGTDKKLVEQGKYMVMIGGCNDCHTNGYLQSEGEVPVSEWLKGSSFGWHGPWGTTYPPNLRLFFKDLSEKQWIKMARTLKRRPPMPWFNLNKMKDEDLSAIYHFVKSLKGDPGKPAPAYIAPGKIPPMPYASFPEPPPTK